MPNVRILLVQPGSIEPHVREQAGDFDAWFRAALSGENIEWRVARPDRGEPLPEAGFDAVLMTGSIASLTEPEPWMDETARWVRNTVEGGTPYLGICFGHQMLGHAFGAPVIKNPLGPELGTFEIELTEAGRKDPLFEGLPARFEAQQTHWDMVAQPPAGATLLARTERTPVQAIAIGRARGVQFHPEMTDRHMRLVAGPKPEVTVRPSPLAPLVLRSFVRGVRAR